MHGFAPEVDFYNCMYLSVVVINIIIPVCTLYSPSTEMCHFISLTKCSSRKPFRVVPNILLQPESQIYRLLILGFAVSRFGFRSMFSFVKRKHNQINQKLNKFKNCHKRHPDKESQCSSNVSHQCVNLKIEKMYQTKLH